MRIGHLSTAYHTAILLQRGKWRDKMRPLKPQWILFGGGPQLVDALAEGKIDIGYVGLPPAMIGICRGASIKCVAGGHMDGTIMAAKPGYKALSRLGGIGETLRQFEGLGIGSPAKGCIHDVILRYLLEKNRIDAEIKNYDWADFIPLAMERGEIEAAVGTPALGGSLINNLGAEIVIPAQAIWPNNPSYGIIVSDDFIEEQPSMLEAFLSLHKDVSGYIRDEPRDAAELASRTIGFVDACFVENIYRISPRYCIALPDEFIETTMEFARVMNDMGYLSRRLRLKDIFETRFIEKIHPERPHY
jgi:NitT/TauT family transport system substrate-binding protein